MKINTIIVDDESLSRRGIELRLREASDFNIVAQCTNGREALSAISTHKPDVVFLDIQMPGMSGFEVLEVVGKTIIPVRQNKKLLEFPRETCTEIGGSFGASFASTIAHGLNLAL